MSGSDPKSVEQVYERYADMLYRIALAYMHNRDDAQDAVHDAFLTYIQKAPRFFDVERERAWMCRVTVNKCRDALRRRSLRQHLSLEDEEVMTLSSAETGMSVELREALSRLPDKLRLATVLHYLEGFSVTEVARVTGSSQSAVKMRLARARDLLKDYFGGETP